MSEKSLDEHLRAVLDKRLGQLVEAMKHARRAQGVEAVHDLRVASRRLRAFGVTFHELIPTKVRHRLEKRLKRVTRAVGALRDLDVQLELVDKRLAAASSETDRAALEHLLEHLEAERKLGLRRAERRLEKVDLDRISRAVRRAAKSVEAALAERDAGDYALSVLMQLVDDAAGHSNARGGESDRANATGTPSSEADPGSATGTPSGEDPERLHRLRIDVKELRYALELFEPVLGPKFEALHGRAEAMQELLGAYHDLVVLSELVGERSARLRLRDRNTLAGGLENALDALAADRRGLLERFQSEGFDPESWRAALRG